MIDRAALVRAVADELDRLDGCSPKHIAIGERVADRLGLRAPASIEEAVRAASRGRVYLFARRTSWTPIEIARRVDGVILATRSASAPKPNRSAEWCETVRAAGVELAGWDWMLPPGAWRAGLADHVRWLASVGASALVLNVEPRPPKSGEDWRGKHAELDAYATEARDLCDRHGLELWVTSWALPPSSFPLLELCRPAHAVIPQPYEVHGQAGSTYVARVIERWREAAPRARLIVGRGAHELDDDDADAWRTPAQIAAHRASTPPGADEAWWLAAGTPPARVVDALASR